MTRICKHKFLFKNNKSFTNHRRWCEGRINKYNFLHPRINFSMLGKKHTILAKEKQSISKKGELNPMWKGDNVQYRALHSWVRRNRLKPLLCEKCQIVPPRDIANISQKYKRDLSDWEWICRRCHMDSDNRLSKLRSYSKLYIKIKIDVEVILYKRYVENKSQQTIANELGVSRQVIRNRLKVENG